MADRTDVPAAVRAALLLLLVGVAWGAVAVPPAHGTQVIAAPIESLAERADAVVRGTVVLVEPKVVDGRVSTVVRVVVAEQLAGDAPGVVTLIARGGAGEDLTTWVAGADRYAVGDEVIVFLVRRSDGYFESMSLSWSLFLLVDPEWAVRDVDGLTLLRRSDSGGHELHVPERSAVSVEELRARVAAGRRARAQGGGAR